MPSIVHVQNSCITTLNDLLSNTPQWRPIIPDRRHSMPSRSPNLSAPSSLYTLVSNLRALDSSGTSSSAATDSDALIRELQIRATRLAAADVFPPQDAVLVRRLVSLIGHFHHLAASQPAGAAPSLPRVASWSSRLNPSAPADPVAALGRQLSDLQLARDASAANSRVVSPVQQVEGALIWAQVDEELEEVLSLCRSRTAVGSAEQPPDYETAWYDVDMEGEGLPQYEPGTVSREDLLRPGTSKASVVGDASSFMERGSSTTLNEKMRMDLEAVTLAIDRLYLVAPQLHDQRVELKKSKLEAMERASRADAVVRKGKQRAREPDDAKELERMVDLIGRASERKIADQSFVLGGGHKAKLERARQRDVEKVRGRSNTAMLIAEDWSSGTPSWSTFCTMQMPVDFTHKMLSLRHPA